MFCLKETCLKRFVSNGKQSPVNIKDMLVINQCQYLSKHELINQTQTAS